MGQHTVETLRILPHPWPGEWLTKVTKGYHSPDTQADLQKNYALT